MPRTPRRILAGQPHHIVKRGINRDSTFRDVSDVDRCLLSLREASRKYGVQIHSYVIMTNHLHLLATPEDAAAVGQCIQSFGVRYARYFNERYGRTGTLWEERYFSEVIDSELYFFQCSRYIELNPVRANIVQNPEEFSASSFRRNALGEADTIVSPHPLYQALAQSAAERATAYRFIFKDHLELVDAQRERLSTKCPWRVSY